MAPGERALPVFPSPTPPGLRAAPGTSVPLSKSRGGPTSDLRCSQAPSSAQNDVFYLKIAFILNSPILSLTHTHTHAQTHTHTLCHQQSLFFQKFCLVSDQPELRRLNGSSQFSGIGWRCPEGPAQSVLDPGHGPLVPTQRRGGLGSWGLLPCTASGWLLASFSRVQAHLRGPRRGATPLTFKQLPPRSRRPPCRGGERV